ncbi:MAG: hypothetical protein IJ061_03210 [Lachnospiraceae bacterium]|nr:hypothetical protein [Lachnospiraceae bacterium]
MNQNEQNKTQDPRYQEPTFQQYCADPKAPRSFKALIAAGLKARIAGYIKGLPRLLKMMVPITIGSTLFNIFFWSVINDTMWAGRGTWGRISFIPYLIGGGVYSGSNYKGATPFELAGITPTGNVVAPLTLGLSLLFSTYMMRKKQGGQAAISEDLASVRKMRDYYEQALGVKPRQSAPKKPAPPDPNQSNTQRMADRAEYYAATNGYADLSNLSNNLYMRIGLCCAVVFGFIIRNPFAVPVFAVLLYFSFGQGGQSDLGQRVFRVRSADGRLHDGRKQAVPRYAESMLIMYYMSIGLFIYTAVNVILWLFFGYNFYVRFLVSAGLIAAIYYRGGGVRKQAVRMIPLLLLVAGGAVLFNCLTVFADDNGWSESGKTIGGLIHNNGFPICFVSSLLPSLFWDLGILLGWMPDIGLPPVMPEMPVPPMPPMPPQNPYDFPERPKEWSLNDEGDVSFIDPITNTRKTYGLVGYDENGNPRYIGENGSYYDLDELLVSYDNAVSNTEYYQDANKGLQEWLEKQRAENQKLSRDGMQYLEDKWRSEAELARMEKEADQLFKMWQKYGGELDNKESIKKAMEKAIGNAQKDAEHYKNVGEFWDYMTKTAQVVEKGADYSLIALSAVTGNKSIKKIYDITKKYASNMSQAYADGKGKEGVGMAFLSTSVESLIDTAAGGLGGDNWHWSAAMTGKIGGEMGKQVWKNLEQGKDWNEGLGTAAFNGTIDYATGKLSDGGWKITSGAGGEAAKKIWSNLEEGKDWHDGVGSAAFDGGVKGGIDKLTDMVKDNQKEITKDRYRRDLLDLNRAQNEGRMSKEGLDSLKYQKYKNLNNNTRAENAVSGLADATSQATKDAYDGIRGEMGKYNRDPNAEHNQKMLKDLADRKKQNAQMEKDKAMKKAQKELEDHRNNIRNNSQKPL